MKGLDTKPQGVSRYAPHLLSFEPARLAALAARRRIQPPQEPAGTRFAVLAPARSGSTLLVDLLNQHPDIEMAGEIFNRGALGEDMRAVASGGGAPVNLLARDLFPRAYLYDFWMRMRAAYPAAAVGYKHIYSQHPRMALKICADPGIRKLFVERRNYLKQYLSYLVARDTRTWASLTSANECAAYAVSIPDLRAWRDDTARQRDVFIACVSETRQEHLVLAYEDFADLATQAAALERTAAFLGLPPARSVRPRLVKQNPYPARAMISNLAEVEEYLRGCGDAWMLDAS